MLMRLINNCRFIIIIYTRPDFRRQLLCVNRKVRYAADKSQ